MGNIEIQKGRGQYDGFAKRVKMILKCGNCSLAIASVCESAIQT